MVHKSKKIQSEISPGELLDKISILEIKINKITNSNSLAEVKKEYKILKKIKDENIESDKKIENLSKHIKQFKKDKHSTMGLNKSVNNIHN